MGNEGSRRADSEPPVAVVDRNPTQRALAVLVEHACADLAAAGLDVSRLSPQVKARPLLELDDSELACLLGAGPEEVHAARMSVFRSANIGVVLRRGVNVVEALERAPPHVAVVDLGFWTPGEAEASCAVGDAKLEQVVRVIARRFPWIRELYLCCCRLTTLSTPHLSRLRSLRVLALRDNRINAEGAMFLGRLKRLQHLDLHGNNLGAMGVKRLSKLALLRTLNVGEAGLGVDGAKCLASRTGLTALDVSANDIEDEGLFALARLTELVYLRAALNGVTVVPERICRFPNLKLLDVRHNRGIVQPPRATCDLGLAAMRRFYADAHESGGTTTVHSAKLILVGAEMAGKTSTSLGLIAEGQPRPTEVADRTRQLDVRRWRPRSHQPLQVAIWDCAGQKQYHGVHHLYLTEDALFMLVVNLSAFCYEQDVRFWLRTIEARVPGASVHIVLTHVDACPDPDAAAQDLMLCLRDEGYPYPHSAVDNRSGAGLAELSSALATRLRSLDHVGQQLPKSWASVSYVMEKVRSGSGEGAFGEADAQVMFVSVPHLCQLARTGRQMILDVVEVLEKAGQVMRFQDMVFLHPPFLAELLKALTDHDDERYYGQKQALRQFVIDNAECPDFDAMCNAQVELLRAAKASPWLVRFLWRNEIEVANRSVFSAAWEMLQANGVLLPLETDPLGACAVLARLDDDPPATARQAWDQLDGKTELGLDIRFSAASTCPPGLCERLIGSNPSRGRATGLVWAQGLIAVLDGAVAARVEAPVSGALVSLRLRGEGAALQRALHRAVEWVDGALSHFPGVTRLLERRVRCPHPSCAMRGSFAPAETTCPECGKHVPPALFSLHHYAEDEAEFLAALEAVRPPHTSASSVLIALCQPPKKQIINLVGEADVVRKPFPADAKPEPLIQPTLEALAEALGRMRGDSCTLHFGGHAQRMTSPDSCGLLFGDEQSPPLEDLAAVLADGGVSTVVLNACSTLELGRALAFADRGLTVVCWLFPLNDELAIEFSTAFYTALAAGLGVDEAFAQARAAAFASASPWLHPLLLTATTPVGEVEAEARRAWLACPPGTSDAFRDEAAQAVLSVGSPAPEFDAVRAACARARGSSPTSLKEKRCQVLRALCANLQRAPRARLLASPVRPRGGATACGCGRLPRVCRRCGATLCCAMAFSEDAPGYWSYRVPVCAAACLPPAEPARRAGEA